MLYVCGANIESYISDQKAHNTDRWCRESFFMGDGYFWCQEGIEFLFRLWRGGGHFCFMRHWQTYLINCIKRLFSWERNTYWIYKNELERGVNFVMHSSMFDFFFMHEWGVVDLFFKSSTTFSYPTSPHQY